MSNLIEKLPAITATTDKVKQAYKTFADAMVTNTKTAQSIIDTFDSLETDEARIELSGTAKECLKAFVSQRTSLDNKRVEIKKPFLLASKEIDSEAKKLTLFSKEVEEALTPIAKYEKVLKEKALQKIREEREDQISIMGAEEFVMSGTDFATFTPEQWDMQLGNYQTLVDAKKAKEQAEAKEREEAERLEAQKQVLRKMRGEMLAGLGYFYAGDLAELSEVDFMQLVAKAQSTKAEREAEARKQAEAEAERLVKEKEEAEEAAKKAKYDKLMQSGDADILLSMATKIDGLDTYVSSFAMSSDKGAKAQEYAIQKLAELQEALRQMAKKLK